MNEYLSFPRMTSSVKLVYLVCDYLSQQSTITGQRQWVKELHFCDTRTVDWHSRRYPVNVSATPKKTWESALNERTLWAPSTFCLVGCGVSRMDSPGHPPPSTTTVLSVLLRVPVTPQPAPSWTQHSSLHPLPGVTIWWLFCFHFCYHVLLVCPLLGKEILNSFEVEIRNPKYQKRTAKKKRKKRSCCQMNNAEEYQVKEQRCSLRS